ncbi:hypothetical protein Q7A53_06065 [Halobacillus rhizosphaerae]|uniref:hypothetical protein n=1 Tax=Halobacillus rhizosphaerae TaxID=3064889 RepID=UPI00398AF51F
MKSIEQAVQDMIDNGEITQEQLDEMVAKHKEASTLNKDVSELGKSLIITYMNDNKLGDLISMAFMNVDMVARMVQAQAIQVQQLSAKITELEEKLEELNNA